MTRPIAVSAPAGLGDLPAPVQEEEEREQTVLYSLSRAHTLAEPAAMPEAFTGVAYEAGEGDAMVMLADVDEAAPNHGLRGCAGVRCAAATASSADEGGADGRASGARGAIRN